MTTLGIAHDRTICHCSYCERFNRSLAAQMIVGVGPKILAAGFLAYFLGHILVWIAKGFPGLMRVSG